MKCTLSCSRHAFAAEDLRRRRGPDKNWRYCDACGKDMHDPDDVFPILLHRDAAGNQVGAGFCSAACRDNHPASR